MGVSVSVSLCLTLGSGANIGTGEGDHWHTGRSVREGLYFIWIKCHPERNSTLIKILHFAWGGSLGDIALSLMI